MDRVFIEALEIDCVIGIYDWERTITQKVVLDIEMAFDNRVPAASDRIEDTLDYNLVSAAVHELAKTSNAQLIERLAEQIAAMLLAKFPADSVALRACKPLAASAIGSRRVGVSIYRTRSTT